MRISCDHLGRPVRTEVLSDDSGPQVSADADDPTVSTMVYDGAGNPVEVLDAEGWSEPLRVQRLEPDGAHDFPRGPCDRVQLRCVRFDWLQPTRLPVLPSSL